MRCCSTFYREICFSSSSAGKKGKKGGARKENQRDSSTVFGRIAISVLYLSEREGRGGKESASLLKEKRGEGYHALESTYSQVNAALDERKGRKKRKKKASRPFAMGEGGAEKGEGHVIEVDLSKWLRNADFFLNWGREGGREIALAIRE